MKVSKKKHKEMKMKVSTILQYDRLIKSQKEFHVLLNLQAPEKESSEKRKTLNICLVLDVSGSMAGKKLDNTKVAAKMIIDNLSSDDYISIVSYSDVINIVVPAQKASSKETTKQLVDLLKADAMTDMHSGWEKGKLEIDRNKNKEYINRILLMTDGLTNTGITDKDSLLKTGVSYLDSDISTTTIGFGEDFDENLLKDIAKKSGGNQYYIQNADIAPKIFERELSGLLSIYADKITAEINTDKNFSFVEIVNEVEKKDNKFLLGDIMYFEKNQFLLKFKYESVDENKKNKFTDLIGADSSEQSLSHVCNINIGYSTGDKVETQEVSVDVAETHDDKFLINENAEVKDYLNFLMSVKSQKAALESLKANDLVKARALFTQSSAFVGNISSSSSFASSANSVGLYNMKLASGSFDDTDVKYANYVNAHRSRGYSSARSSVDDEDIKEEKIKYSKKMK